MHNLTGLYPLKRNTVKGGRLGDLKGHSVKRGRGVESKPLVISERTLLKGKIPVLLY